MKVRILVIDDDAAVRRVVETMLQRAGYEVWCAEDGRRGVVAFKACRPDLVITDIIMPDKEGIGTILELRSIWPDGPIIAMSGSGESDGYLGAAKNLGADATLCKPFEPEALLAAVTRCLKERPIPT